MKNGSELSRTVAIFIVQKILMDDAGLVYICQTYERFYAVTTVLNDMVVQLAESQAIRLIKHVIRCYLRLSDNPRWWAIHYIRLFQCFLCMILMFFVYRAREALRQCLPDELRDATFVQILKDDITTQRCLNQLLINLSDNWTYLLWEGHSHPPNMCICCNHLILSLQLWIFLFLFRFL
jgi:CCR4-NOT transcription complex subunit 9